MPRQLAIDELTVMQWYCCWHVSGDVHSVVLGNAATKTCIGQGRPGWLCSTGVPGRVNIVRRSCDGYFPPLGSPQRAASAGRSYELAILAPWRTATAPRARRPLSGSSVGRSRTRSRPHAQRGVYGSGLDWAYVPLPTPPERLEERCAGSRRLVSWAQTSRPRTSSPSRVLRNRRPVGQHARRPRRSDRGLPDRRGDPRRSPRRRPAVLGDGGTAAAFLHALPHARQFARRGSWPPDVTDADLVVNATSERDETLVEVGAGQTLIDLPYPRPPRRRCDTRRGPRDHGGRRARSPRVRLR